MAEKPSQEETRNRKIALYENVRAGKLSIGQATREMRKIVGLTQKEYAEKVLKIFPRVLLDIENDRGNPTLETLQKVAAPFGFKVGFVKPEFNPGGKWVNAESALEVGLDKSRTK
jgi:transcriptional regulator with XRE-family HTH domain